MVIGNESLSLPYFVNSAAHGFVHVTISSSNACSNGFIERTVETKEQVFCFKLTFAVPALGADDTVFGFKPIFAVPAL